MLIALAQLAALLNGIDPKVFVALIHIESSFNPRAKSKNAYGLAQLTKPTIKRFCPGIKVFDPAQNLNCGAKVLRYQLDRYKDLRKALSAYNAGTYTPKNHDYVRRVELMYILK